MPGFLQDAQLQTYVAGILKKQGIDLTTLANGNPSYWPSLITQSNSSAWGEIQSRLIGRGWTPAQILTWDRGIETQYNIGTWFALSFGGMLDGFNALFIDTLKRYFDGSDSVLSTVLLTANSVWQVPMDTPGTIGTGQLDTNNDVFVMDSQDPRIGQITRW